MKWSPYNYLFKSNKYGYLIYNSYSNTFAQLDEKTYKEVQKIQKNPENYDYSNSTSLLFQLCGAKMLISKDEIPTLNMDLSNTVKRFSTRNLSLTIAPTRDCNFECPYCYEEDRPHLYMSKEVENNLVKFIKKYRNFSSISITWYGGEPLLCWNKILKISKEIQKMKPEYYSEIITNGFLLTPKIARQFKDAGIKSVQITIDGMQETHNNRRKHKTEKDTFNVILKNLDYLMKVWKGRLVIRINVDKTNHEEYHQVYSMIKERFKESENELVIYPGIIVDYSNDCRGDKTCGMNRQQIADFMLECYNKFQIMDLNFYPLQNNSTCTAVMLHSYLIGPEGELYKCWRDLGKKEMIVGSIDGNIPTNNNIISKYLVGINSYTSSKCSECFFLPICNGGCPNLRYRNKYENTKFDTCLFHKNNLDSFLEAHYEIKQNNEKED
ncbi:MAG: radical SAM protein [Candidatus Muiribacteriota bacterium]